MGLGKQSPKMINYDIINVGSSYKREMFNMGDKSPKNKEKKKKKAEKKVAHTTESTILSNKSE